MLTFLLFSKREGILEAQEIVRLWTNKRIKSKIEEIGFQRHAQNAKPLRLFQTVRGKSTVG
jgi:hypothetical protein